MSNRTRKEKIQLLRDLVAGRIAVSDLCTPPLKVFYTYTYTGTGYDNAGDPLKAITGNPGEVWHIEHPSGQRWTNEALQAFKRKYPSATIVRVIRTTEAIHLLIKDLT